MSQAAKSLASTAGSAPESLILLVFLILVAILAKRAGSLPGSGMQFLGDAAVGVSCACLYAGLGILYCQVSLKEGRSTRRILRILGLCLLLAAISTHIFMLLLAPAVWDKFFYLRYFSPPAFVGLWCIALLPRETRDLCRIAGTTQVVDLLRPVVILLVAAAFLVTCSDLALEFGVPSGSDLQKIIIQKNAWVTNIIILFGAYALAFAVTSKVATALLFVSPFYVVLGLATLAKLKYMHAAVSPLDLIRVPEFLPLFQAFFGTGVLAVTVCVFLVWIVSLVALRRIAPYRTPLVFRWSIGVFSLVVLLAVPALYAWPRLNDRLERRIGAPIFLDTKEFTRDSGFLLTFLAEIPSSFVFPPPNYSPETVAVASRRLRRHDLSPPDRSRGRRVNLIVYMVESFMPPEDLGWHYSSDPIPNMRVLLKTSISGYGIVPGKFGGSADTEFEVLTGMSMSLVPRHSLPYRQFVRRPMPSLPGALKHLGYRTIAIQADPKNFYNREQVYNMLGFDEVFWLHEMSGIERAPPGYWPSDKAIVETVIQASQQARPFFIFAFPSSTHSPYNSGVYRNSDLGVLDPPLGDAAGEVKEYINRLRVADQAIGMLIEYFRGQSDPTMIVIIGDHLPPLSGEAFHSFNTNLSGLSKAEQDWKARSVPLLVWANFDLPREEAKIGMNVLPSYLLEKMRISPQGFLAGTDAVRLRLPILGDHVRRADGSICDWNSLSHEEIVLVDDYTLLQYDLLIGKQYSLRGSPLRERENAGGPEPE